VPAACAVSRYYLRHSQWLLEVAPCNHLHELLNEESSYAALGGLVHAIVVCSERERERTRATQRGHVDLQHGVTGRALQHGVTGRALQHGVTGRALQHGVTGRAPRRAV
jgi:hypothetical protein